MNKHEMNPATRCVFWQNICCNNVIIAMFFATFAVCLPLHFDFEQQVIQFEYNLHLHVPIKFSF